jgi:hypothetical protein
MIDIGDKKSKYQVTISCKAYASKGAAYVYCNSVKELNELIEANYEDILESGTFSENVSNDFDLDDCAIEDDHGIIDDELSLYYLNQS